MQRAVKAASLTHQVSLEFVLIPPSDPYGVVTVCAGNFPWCCGRRQLGGGDGELGQTQSMAMSVGDPEITIRYAYLSSRTLQAAANATSVIVPRVQPSAANMDTVEVPQAA